MSKIAGELFCITEKLNYPGGREALMNFITTNGGFLSTSVYRGVDYLISNYTTTESNVYKATTKLGVQVVTEAELMDMAANR